MAEPAFLTIAQAAELLQVDHKTIRRAIHAGRLKATKLGAVWRIRREAIAALEGVDQRPASGEGQVRRRPEPRPRTDTVLPAQPSPLRLVADRGRRPSTSGRCQTGGAS